jgi:S-adenosylmethionine synthetase
VSCQHDPKRSQKDIMEDIKREVIDHAIPKSMMTSNCRIFVNPTGRFVIGGPQGDAGLTGRKIIVDTYGGWIPHGGGAFSGKDPTKVDRSAAYAARWVAKNIVGAGLADECTVQLAYAIGVAEPVSLMVDTKGTGKMSNEELETRVRKVFDLTPKGIIQSLDLRRPVYRDTASYGHFGRSGDGFTWEKLNRVEQLQK